MLRAAAYGIPVSAALLRFRLNAETAIESFVYLCWKRRRSPPPPAPLVSGQPWDRLRRDRRMNRAARHCDHHQRRWTIGDMSMPAATITSLIRESILAAATGLLLLSAVLAWWPHWLYPFVLALRTIPFLLITHWSKETMSATWAAAGARDTYQERSCASARDLGGKSYDYHWNDDGCQDWRGQSDFKPSKKMEVG
jgi:hypothetical protein